MIIVYFSKALLRSGRIDRKIEFPLPNEVSFIIHIVIVRFFTLKNLQYILLLLLCLKSPIYIIIVS